MLDISATWLDEGEEVMRHIRYLPRIKSVRIERVTEGLFIGSYFIYLRVFFSGGYCERRKDIFADDELGAVADFIKMYSCHVTFGEGDEQSSD
jgi:hypothetical protein